MNWLILGRYNLIFNNITGKHCYITIPPENTDTQQSHQKITATQQSHHKIISIWQSYRQATRTVIIVAAQHIISLPCFTGWGLKLIISDTRNEIESQEKIPLSSAIVNSSINMDMDTLNKFFEKK